MDLAETMKNVLAKGMQQQQQQQQSELSSSSGGGFPSQSYVTEKLYMLLQLYLQNKGWNPSVELLQCFTELKETSMLPSAAYLQMMASRVTLDSQGRLILRDNGKIILPFEHFANAVMLKHMNGPHGLHLGIEATVRAVMESYTIGREQFGMEKDFIIEVVQNCPNPACRYYKNQMELTQKTLQHLAANNPNPNNSFSLENNSQQNTPTSFTSSGNNNTDFPINAATQSLSLQQQSQLQQSQLQQSQLQSLSQLQSQSQLQLSQLQSQSQSQQQQQSKSQLTQSSNISTVSAVDLTASEIKPSGIIEGNNVRKATTSSSSQQLQQQQLTAALLQQQSRVLAQQNIDKINASLEKQRLQQQQLQLQQQAAAAAVAKQQQAHFDLPLMDHKLTDFLRANLESLDGLSSSNKDLLALHNGAWTTSNSGVSGLATITASSNNNANNNNNNSSGGSGNNNNSGGNNNNSGGNNNNSGGNCGNNINNSGGVNNNSSSSVLCNNALASNVGTPAAIVTTTSAGNTVAVAVAMTTSGGISQLLEEKGRIVTSCGGEGGITAATANTGGQEKIVRAFGEVMKNMARMKTYVRPSMCKPYGKQSEALQKTLIDTIQLIQSLRSFLPPPHIQVSSWKNEDKHRYDDSQLIN